MAKTLQLWSPYHPVEDFRREFDDLFSRFLEGRRRSAGFISAAPPIESFLNGREFVIRLDLPGIDPKDVEVTVGEDVITVRASREHHDKRGNLDFNHCEMFHGGFERSVALPRGIRGEDAKATYKHGVLELRMPAPKETAGRKVPIQVETSKAENS
jgi:HSP20 family protein